MQFIDDAVLRRRRRRDGRLRTQAALDETERNFCAAKRDAENRLRDLDELKSASAVTKEKLEKKLKVPKFNPNQCDQIKIAKCL